MPNDEIDHDQEMAEENYLHAARNYVAARKRSRTLRGSTSQEEREALQDAASLAGRLMREALGELYQRDPA